MREITGDISSWSELIEMIREDWETNQRDWRLPGFRALLVYRLGRWQTGLRGRTLGVRLLRRASGMIYRVLYHFVRNHYGIELPRTARVGRRLKIANHGGIVIHRKAVIGDDCILRQGVTIGAAADFHREDPPRVGNHVNIGANAMILGPVVVGDRVRVGPGAVILRDVPPGVTAFAGPARFITPEADDGSEERPSGRETANEQSERES